MIHNAVPQPVDHIAWRRLAVSCRNVAFHIKWLCRETTEQTYNIKNYYLFSHDTLTFDISNEPCQSSFQNTPCQSSARNAVARYEVIHLIRCQVSTFAIISATLRSSMTLLFALILIYSSLVTSPRVLWSTFCSSKRMIFIHFFEPFQCVGPENAKIISQFISANSILVFNSEDTCTWLKTHQESPWGWIWDWKREQFTY